MGGKQKAVGWVSVRKKRMWGGGKKSMNLFQGWRSWCVDLNGSCEILGGHFSAPGEKKGKSYPGAVGLEAGGVSKKYFHLSGNRGFGKRQAMLGGNEQKQGKQLNIILFQEATKEQGKKKRKKRECTKKVN